MMSLGQWLLRRERAKPGRTDVELARRCGMTPSAINRLANGERRQPTLTYAIAIRDHVGIPVDAWEIEFDPSEHSVPRGTADRCTTEDEGDDVRKEALLTALAVIGARDSTEMQKREAHGLVVMLLNSMRGRHRATPMRNDTEPSTARAPFGDHQ